MRIRYKGNQIVKTHPFSVSEGRVSGERLTLKQVMLLEGAFPKVDLNGADNLLPPEVQAMVTRAKEEHVFQSLSCRGFDSEYPRGMRPDDPAFHAKYSNGAVEGVLIGVKYGEGGETDFRSMEFYLLAGWGNTRAAAEQTVDQVWARQSFYYNVSANDATYGAKHKLWWGLAAWVAVFLAVLIYDRSLLPGVMIGTFMLALFAGFLPAVQRWWHNLTCDSTLHSKRKLFEEDFPSPQAIRKS